ncbi:N-acetylmuramic acid 6-phosphate etherase [Sporanaerobacter sp. PP17-6a]|uniref:N-acetylmuramic acid 6-phosphate etherase n=1 Tax=Sporanaerobacter sp. PP17-6a TaxID=1891289 RepID=UPI00089FFE6A|nr:N-acetylmuramic acid 6-phosphate etherase [Sporanaerobacter sp. PP17-6a]SCL87100.1 N-acetylmuramic acid 6-phosphate etherase [Sporanaerobacter sp. PP17-6a]
MNTEKAITEERNPDTMDIDLLSTEDMLKKINDEDKKVAYAVEREIPNIAKAVDEIGNRLQNGGRLIYIGAGTSGRLGVLDASECPPTFSTDPQLVQGIIAGGDSALRISAEGAEDDYSGGKIDLKDKNITSKDAIVGIAASGTTPYVIGALEYAKGIGAYTSGICCIKETPMSRFTDVMITPIVGPEAIAGSTRMKAGTAQKLVLNMISTGVMIKLGKVCGNLMVNVKASNKKLVKRAEGIVKQVTDADEEYIQKVLEENNYDVKLAIVMILANIDSKEAQRILNREGNIRKALKWSK